MELKTESPIKHTPAHEEHSGRGGRVVVVLLVIALLLGGGWWLRNRRAARQTAATPGKAGGTKKGMNLRVPVAATAAHRGDIPYYLSGLGNVTAFYTTTVRSRVDGQLMKVGFQEGQYVRAGDLLAEIDSRPFQVQLLQAQGQMARDQALLENARLDLKRYEGLMGDDAIPKQQLDTQRALVNQYLGTLKADEAAVENAKLQITYCHITAPIDGRVGLRLVDPGNMVRAADTTGLLVITQLQPIAVLFTLPEDALQQVLKRMRGGAQLRVDAFNRDAQTRVATGTLLTLDNQIDVTTGTTKLKAIFPNKDNALFPNQFINARLLLETQRNKIIIPTAAVQRGPSNTYVYVVDAKNRAHVRPIQTGISEGNDTAIESGLEPGEMVIVDGVDKLQEGSPVELRTPTGDPVKGSKRRG